jgi:glycosyltransferase involved in cell wall biosynthesis
MLVSCVMPTYNRREFIPAAIACWLAQDYEDKELIILDDGDDGTEEVIPFDVLIHYERSARLSTGAKRNSVNQRASGEIICHWDDDDWSAPDRISDQVERLIESGKPITGYSNLYFWDTISREARLYKATWPGYVCGTSLMYLKSYWEAHPFPDKQKASDNDFIYGAGSRNIADSYDASHMVARLHRSGHTGGNHSGIGEVVPVEMVPSGFWDNERLRLA